MLSKFSPASMHAVIPAGEYGSAKVLHDSPDALTRMRAAMCGQPLGCEVYTRLIVNNTLWMTDAEFEWRSNLEAVNRMTGDILIAGLGIGFVIHPILGRPNVSSITVIEKNADVIALIAPRFPTVNVIHADAREWRPTRRSYDCVYLDIWPDVPSSDQREDIKALKKKYRPGLRKGGWVKAWCEDRAR